MGWGAGRSGARVCCAPSAPPVPHLRAASSSVRSHSCAGAAGERVWGRRGQGWGCFRAVPVARLPAGCGGASAHSERLLAWHLAGTEVPKPRFAHLRGGRSELCPGGRAVYFGGCPGEQAAPRAASRAVLCGVCAMRGGVPALIQSRDAIGFTSALGIWDSAGRGSVMHQSGSQYSLCGRGSLSQWPARPPMGAIQALLITVSHRAVRVGHIPHLSYRTAESFNKRLRSFPGGTCDRTSPSIWTKDTGKFQLLHAIKKRGAQRAPGLGRISNPMSIPQPFRQAPG